MSNSGYGGVGKYTEQDLSLESWARFAKTREGKAALNAAILDYADSHPRYKKFAKYKNQIRENIGKTVRISDATESDMVDLANTLADMIEKYYINSLSHPERGRADLRGHPIVDVRVKEQCAYIHYTDYYLRRQSLMNAYSGGAWGRRGRTRIGKGLKDIYGYFAKGQKVKPKRVIGFWTSTSQRFPNVKTDPVVIGNYHIQTGSDFVVEAINAVFKMSRFDKLSDVRVAIPSAWSKSGWTVFDKSNNAWISGILSPEDIDRRSKSESVYDRTHVTGLKL